MLWKMVDEIFMCRGWCLGKWGLRFFLRWLRFRKLGVEVCFFKENWVLKDR